MAFYIMIQISNIQLTTDKTNSALQMIGTDHFKYFNFNTHYVHNCSEQLVTKHRFRYKNIHLPRLKLIVKIWYVMYLM